MIKVIEFKDILAEKYCVDEFGESYLVRDSDNSFYAIDQLNDYLKEYEQEIDLIEIQKHSDCYVLIYRVNK